VGTWVEPVLWGTVDAEEDRPFHAQMVNLRGDAVVRQDALKEEDVASLWLC
jgi:hypothetical protein